MMGSNANRGPTVPRSASKDHVPYDQGRNDSWPDMNFTYKHFTRIMNIPLEDVRDGAEALARAEKQHGAGVRVLRTARYWVAYRE